MTLAELGVIPKDGAYAVTMTDAPVWSVDAMPAAGLYATALTLAAPTVGLMAVVAPYAATVTAAEPAVNPTPGA